MLPTVSRVWPSPGLSVRERSTVWPVVAAWQLATSDRGGALCVHEARAPCRILRSTQGWRLLSRSRSQILSGEDPGKKPLTKEETEKFDGADKEFLVSWAPTCMTPPRLTVCAACAGG